MLSGWLSWAGWIPEQRPVPLALARGDLLMIQRTAVGVCQGPPRKTKSYSCEDITCFLLLAFLHCFLFWLECELSMSLPCITFS